MGIGIGVDARQPADKAQATTATLDHDDAAFGKVADQLIVAAHELTPRAVSGQQPLGQATVLNAVDDAQCVLPVAQLMHQHSVIVACGQRLIHAIDPHARIVGCRTAGGPQ